MNSRKWHLAAAMGTVVISLAVCLPADGETLPPASEAARTAPLLNWAFVRVLDPYGNPLSQARTWVYPREATTLSKELREVAAGWYFGGPILRMLTDVAALHHDYTMGSVPLLGFSPSKPLAATTVHMLENDASLEGFVTDSSNGQPIYPAFLLVARMRPEDPTRLYGVTYASRTDESGHFYYEMASGLYAGIIISADGYDTFEVQPYYAPAGASTLDFTMDPLPRSGAKAEPGERIQIQIEGDYYYAPRQGDERQSSHEPVNVP